MKNPNILTVDPKEIPSPVLKRLIAEVRHQEHCSVCQAPETIAYNRFHNRHHRSMEPLPTCQELLKIHKGKK